MRLDRRAARAALLASGLADLSLAAAAQSLLRLLVGFNGDKGCSGLQKVGDEFGRQTGVRVVVQHLEGAPDSFTAAAGKGPDIMCWAHDRVGEQAESGLLVPALYGRVRVTR